MTRNLRSGGIARKASLITRRASGRVSSSDFIQHLAEALVEERKHLLDLLAVANQRRAEGQPMRVEAAEQPVRQGTAADAEPETGVQVEALLRLPVPYKFDALQQALAANVADDRVLLRQSLEAGAQNLALPAGVGAQVALDDFAQDGDTRGAGDGTALERVALD